MEVLDNVLTTTEESTEVDNDEVGFSIVKSSENYGAYLLNSLGEQDSVDVVMENVGKRSSQI